MASGSETLTNISERIRELRTEKRMSLKELSERTGLSVSFLSQVERGTSSLAIASLEKIAVALAIPISDFFTKATPSRYVTRKDEQVKARMDYSPFTLSHLAGSFPERKLDPLIVELESKEEQNRFNQHSGEEFYYVLEGEIIFSVEDEKYHLKEGDAIHFPSDIPHRISNPFDGKSKLISVLTPCKF